MNDTHEKRFFQRRFPRGIHIEFAKFTEKCRIHRKRVKFAFKRGIHVQLQKRGIPRGTQKNVHGTHGTNLPALATYLPTSPGAAKSRTQRRRGGRGGSLISRPVLCLLRTCADVRFSVQIHPKPAGDLKNSARERAHPLMLIWHLFSSSVHSCSIK